MGGNNLRSWSSVKTFFRSRVLQSILISVFLHVIVLCFLSRSTGYVLSVVSASDASSLKLTLSEPSFLVSRQDSALVASHQYLPKPNRSSSRGPVGIHVPANEIAPVLLSEIDLTVEDFRITGRLLLNLDIDEVGRVAGLEVVFSELPEQLSNELARQFQKAIFRPAMRSGKPFRKAILLMIEVD